MATNTDMNRISLSLCLKLARLTGHLAELKVCIRTEIPQNTTKKLMQAGGFYFHVCMCECSDIKLAGQTNTTLFNFISFKTC